MRRDLWRFATPLLALGVSFVVVLIIGAAARPPNPKSSCTPTAQQCADLTIMAVAQPTGQGQSSPPAQPSQSHSPSQPPQRSLRGQTLSATPSSSNGRAAIPGAQPTSKSPSPSVSSSSPVAS